MNLHILPRTSVHAGDLILVNRWFPVVEDGGSHSLVPVWRTHPEILLERRAAALLSRLIGGLDGWSSITPVSGWRSQEEQRDIYTHSLRENGPAFTKQFVALPGHSEHQTGLAIDLGLTRPDIDFIRPDFPYSGICQEFRARAAACGFVERYPSGKEAVTGIAHEPWHFRYVGRPHAGIMMDKGLVLEEYHDFLKEFPLGGEPLFWRSGALEYSIFYVEEAQGGALDFPLAPDGRWSVSGDNESGFIVTTWREVRP